MASISRAKASPVKKFANWPAMASDSEEEKGLWGITGISHFPVVSPAAIPAVYILGVQNATIFWACHVSPEKFLKIARNFMFKGLRNTRFCAFSRQMAFSN